MSGYRCPFCSEFMSVTPSTRNTRRISFDKGDVGFGAAYPHLEITTYKCPNEDCGEYSVEARGVNGFIDDSFVFIYPQAVYKHYPNYIPEYILEDYEEACSILTLSPKASATLSRRCLQGMIHDFWNIHEKNLNAEITSLKGKVPAAQWKAIDAVRNIGNIGAHMEHDVRLIVDIDIDEAEKLLRLIEHLIETWYIDRYESEQLYADLVSISDQKTAARKQHP